MINLGINNYTMKPFRGTEQNSVPLSHQQVTFCGVTEELSKRFIKTQKEIIDEFVKDPASDWIAGNLPKSWLAKINHLPKNQQKEIQEKVFLVFRSAIKHLKPYCAPKYSKEYNQHKAELENRRLKEASIFLTKGLRKFGILPETNTVSFKILKVNGSYTKRAYLLREKGKNPTLEKLFIKKFTKLKTDYFADFNGQFSEIAHGLYLNKKIKSKYMGKFYWGDTKTGYMAEEYQTLPQHASYIVKFKNYYPTMSSFFQELHSKTGIHINELTRYGVVPGKKTNKGFEPYSKEHIIIGLLQAILKKHGLFHNDLHNLNAIIGSTNDHKPIVKLVDIGGLSEISKPSNTI